MGVSTEFEALEQNFFELIGEFRSLTTSEARLRESLRAECTRAEAAEAGRTAAERAEAEARSGAAAATAAVSKATAALASAQEQLTALKIHLELTEKQRKLLEEQCSEMSTQISALERQVQQMKPLQSAHSALHRQYTELQERINCAAEEARRESSRLESELRRVEKCASAGAEIRERARLAAAAHAREKRLAAAELQHINNELVQANTEISKLKAVVSELQYRLSESGRTIKKEDFESEALSEVRAALEAERAGTTKLQRALAAAIAGNATLSAQMQATDNITSTVKVSASPEPSIANANNCPIDSFLAE